MSFLKHGRLSAAGGITHSRRRSLRRSHQRIIRAWGQVILRWNTQRGVVVIPKSTHKERIGENSDIWDFTLTEDEMQQISSLDQKKGCLPAVFGWDRTGKVSACCLCILGICADDAAPWAALEYDPCHTAESDRGSSFRSCDNNTADSWSPDCGMRRICLCEGSVFILYVYDGPFLKRRIFSCLKTMTTYSK